MITANGGDPAKFERGLYFGDASATLNAIASGGGVGVVRDVLAAHMLADGRLIKLPFKSVPGVFAYHFLCPHHRFDQPRVQSFLSWLRQEAQSG